MSESDLPSELEPQTRTVSRVQAMRYSAATHNAHRIHYDDDYARHEGHERPLVHGPLLGSMLCSYLAGHCVGGGAPIARCGRIEPADESGRRDGTLRCRAGGRIVVTGSAEIEPSRASPTDTHRRGGQT